MLIILLILLSIMFVFIYCCLVVSKRCSEKEEIQHNKSFNGEDK